ncbi:neuronal acetylcholine receptor subunit alpha-6-like [Pecten maximus]|uniref:neuronal acetylcholine receptor subunit alpha-6-like n=1 Tax=Pecten maximus TaxID=6579 RepID=UPI00145832E1|nr:neuronal acetylcholine receptor subunit alpha-6-like [Pecten maximus]
MDIFPLLITVLSSIVVEATTIEKSKLLLQDLFQNYSKDIRPVEDQSKPITVNIDLDIVSINDFDDVAGTISMVVILYISWNDESLVWNSTSFGNTTSLTFPQSKLWIPEMFLCNPADSLQPISNKHFKVSLSSNGDVTWTPGALLTATCTPNVYRYPFDQQTCQLQLSPWGYSSQQVKLKIPSSTILFNYFHMNSEWDVKASLTYLWSGSFDIAEFFITIERRHMNFLVSVVIPVIMLAFVNLFVFLLPFNSGERASYSITVLLAFTVYMTVVSDRMPASSQPMSYISYYLLSLVGISVVIVTVNIFQIRTYSKHDEDEPVPEWVRTLYLYTQNIFRRKKVNTSERLHRPDGSDSKTNNGLDNNHILDVDSSKRNHDLFYTSILPMSQGQEKPTTDNVPMIPDHQPEVVTWHMAAKIVDTLLFFLFFSFTIATTVSYFICANVN